MVYKLTFTNATPIYEDDFILKFGFTTFSVNGFKCNFYIFINDLMAEYPIKEKIKSDYPNFKSCIINKFRSNYTTDKNNIYMTLILL